jgi:hypothetical protein
MYHYDCTVPVAITYCTSRAVCIRYACTVNTVLEMSERDTDGVMGAGNDGSRDDNEYAIHARLTVIVRYWHWTAGMVSWYVPTDSEDRITIGGSSS